ncbi:DUF551 domain-containing protein [Cronobacter malonaticus]|uniref:DUF551 domain-containing protein n=1 Tax=Cronobacter malonaticus TaxID=413503 RepID=UPI0024C3EF0E|nr:DUF551 domain-containing protein [Cronobacter malonaticus]MDK1178711.1 DUF551 domain-containing protein [Cronobacter malonaticus]MDK1689570.1 DUF551 domain-containing protein [Cronobacter malonaticus]
MSEISEVIASEIADFFAGFGGPGEPDIQSGEAQRLLTERLLSVLALRERAEPVYQLWSSGINQWVECDKGRYEAHAHVPAQRRVLYTAPPAPVAAGWIACRERMPELNTRVLLYFPDYGGHIEDGCIGDEGDGPYHYFFDGDSLRHEPTHWMPLPEAPAKN